MKLKGYILTWHYLDNYGSNLQAYALQELLKKRDVGVRFLNYRKGAKTGTFNSFLRWLKYHILFKDSKNLRKKKFYEFRRKYLKETKMLNEKNVKNFKISGDFIICGSDQIWSSRIFDKEYFLDFCYDLNIKKFSYAPSTIEDNYTKEQIKIIKKDLQKFQKISVRESLGTKILKKYTDKEIVEVLDPTLVLPKEDWHKLTKNNCPYANYVVCYFIGEDDKYEDKIKEIKEKYSCENIININIKDIHNFGDVILKSASPIDFLNLIKNANVVVSDSYHAILFALIYQKEFIAIKRFEESDNNNQNERINNILKKINCIDRYINVRDSIKNINKVNYKEINKCLSKYIQDSNKYIDSIINEVKNDSFR